MRDLEQAIAEWRRQMRSNGIRSRVLLDELESHLRDDVEEKMRSGFDMKRAFEASVRSLGPTTAIKTEFENAHSHLNPEEQMKRLLRNILAIIAIIAIEMGFIMPALAQWRTLAAPSAWDMTLVVAIGAIVFTAVTIGAASLTIRALDRITKRLPA